MKIVNLQYWVRGSEDFDNLHRFMSDQEIATYPHFDENGFKTDTILNVWTPEEYTAKFGEQAYWDVFAEWHLPAPWSSPETSR